MANKIVYYVDQCGLVHSFYDGKSIREYLVDGDTVWVRAEDGEVIGEFTAWFCLSDLAARIES